MFNTVQVETTNYCNAHCVFCLHDRIKKHIHMDESLYRKIVDDAAQYRLHYFIPMMNGEPFMDPNIMARLRYARGKLRPETVIRLFINGSIVTKKQIDEMAELGNISLDVSINGPNREIRQTLMGLDDFDEVKEKIKYIHGKGMLDHASAVWFPTLTIEDINALGQFPKPLALVMHNWAGELYPYRRLKPTNCIRVSDVCGILADGRVSLCCFDPFCKVKLGDMNNMTLKEVWESPEHQRYLDYHRQSRGQELPLCRHCTQG